MMGGFQLSELEELNNLSYCKDHGREVCHACNADYSYLNGSFSAFELPRHGVPQYPKVLKSISDKPLRKLLGKRWLEMQRELYQGQAVMLTSSLIKLPLVEVPDEVRTSPEVSQRTLLQLFHQLKGIASTQRYYFANQSKILLQEYEIFNQAAVLYKEELSDQFSRGVSLLTLGDAQLLPQNQRRRVNTAKAKANILSAFGFFLELNTQRTFWRVMELTAEAFVLHVKSLMSKLMAKW